MAYSIPFQIYCLPVVLFSSFFSVFLHVCKISRSRYERHGEFSIKDKSDWDA